MDKRAEQEVLPVAGSTDMLVCWAAGPSEDEALKSKNQKPHLQAEVAMDILLMASLTSACLSV